MDRISINVRLLGKSPKNKTTLDGPGAYWGQYHTNVKIGWVIMYNE